MVIRLSGSKIIVLRLKVLWSFKVEPQLGPRMAWKHHRQRFSYGGTLSQSPSRDPADPEDATNLDEYQEHFRPSEHNNCKHAKPLAQVPMSQVQLTFCFMNPNPLKK